MDPKHVPLRRTLGLQRRIYQSLLSRIAQTLGKTPETIQGYQRESQIDFRVRGKRLKKISKDSLVQAVLKADVTLIGDYHTYDQAQRTALRIMREAVTSESEWFLGLELVSSEFQPVLDSFQKGNLSVSAFHDAISYQDEWGFPWENYAPLFEWARNNQVRLIALNQPKQTLSSLKPPEDLYSRDEWAARIITEYFVRSKEENKHPKFFVLYGEFHIGSPHLPEKIKIRSQQVIGKPLSTLVLHQNVDSLYWRLAQENLIMETEAIRLKRHVYCIFSGTPWAKLQSVLTWAEGGDPEAGDEDCSSDYLSLMQTYGHAVGELLKIPAPSYDDLNLCTIDQIELLDSLVDLDPPFSAVEMNLIRHHVLNNRSLYIPRAKIAYLGSPSHNRLSDLAGVYLLRKVTNNENLFRQTEDDFYRLVLEATFGFFSSLILNPRRKCDLIQDHAARVSGLDSGEKPDFPFEKKARELTIKLVHPGTHKRKLGILEICKKGQYAFSLMMAARFTGKILGKKIHLSLLQGKLSTELILELFLKRAAGDYQERFLELIEVIPELKIPSSRSENL